MLVNSLPDASSEFIVPLGADACPILFTAAPPYPEWCKAQEASPGLSLTRRRTSEESWKTSALSELPISVKLEDISGVVSNRVTFTTSEPTLTGSLRLRSTPL
jgi:hypothetical protein